MQYYFLDNEYKGEYLEIAQNVIVEKQSKFISYLFKISSEEEALEKINQIKKDNVSARHVVYIYSYIQNNILNIKFSDDGEPKGTGTKFIYEMIQREKITNLCIIIVRYFGGILLGAGPLARVYFNVAKQCIEKCQKQELYNYIDYNIEISYNLYDVLLKEINEYISKKFVIMQDTVFEDKIKLSLKVVDFELENVKKVIGNLNYANI